MYKNAYNELDVFSLYLGNYGSRFYLREISERSKLPLRTTQIALSNMEEAGTVKSFVHGRNKYFILNAENPATKLYLLQSEVTKTIAFLERYPAFKLFLKGFSGNAPIILFGSFAKFSASKDSDADMIIVSKSEKLPAHLLPYDIHEVRLTEESFAEALDKEPLLKEVAKNHIVLNGHSFYVNAMWRKYQRQIEMVLRD